jgi:hypothetical protein
MGGARFVLKKGRGAKAIRMKNYSCSLMLLLAGILLFVNRPADCFG